MRKQLLTLIVVACLLAAGVGVAFWYGRELGLVTGRNEFQRADEAIELKAHKVVAQGKIVPFGGSVLVSAAPGQRVEKWLVKEGALVKAGDKLAELSGDALLQKQVDLARAQNADAKVELDQKLQTAESQLELARSSEQAAKLKLEQAQFQSDFSVEEKRIANAKIDLQRSDSLSLDPVTRNLVASQQLNRQKLELEEAEKKLAQSKKLAEQALVAARGAWESSKRQVEMAEKALQALKQNGLQTPSENQASAITQQRLAESKSPISGTVLRLFLKEGESIANMPLVQLGDLTRMECVAEVNDRLIGQVQLKQSVILKSPALSRDLHGEVVEIGRIVGNSTLADPNPFAMVDKKTVEVRVEIDAADAELVRNLINLQVTVEIDTESENSAVVGGENQNSSSTSKL